MIEFLCGFIVGVIIDCLFGSVERAQWKEYQEMKNSDWFKKQRQAEYGVICAAARAVQAIPGQTDLDNALQNYAGEIDVPYKHVLENGRNFERNRR